MIRIIHVMLASVGIVFIAGCAGSGLITNQKVQATKEWNEARANVLASLAADQFRDGSLEKCEETVAQALRLQPDNSKLYLLQAKLSIEEGKLEAAESQLVTARRLDPKNAEIDFLDGIVLQRWQQMEKAAAAYAEAERKDPSDPSYLLAHAEMLVALKQPENALAELQKKCDDFSHNSAIYDEMGQLLIQQNRVAEGIVHLEKACMLAPQDPTTREHLAFALLANQQFEEAAGYLEPLAREPGTQKRADIQAAMGECRSRENRLAEARVCLEQATQLNPSCGGYWLRLAKVEIQLDDFPAAEISARKAISLDPKNSDAHSLLGYAKLKENQLPQSLAAFRSAFDLNPSDSVSLTMQGYILQCMGQKQEACRLYANALQVNPKDILALRLSNGSNGSVVR